MPIAYNPCLEANQREGKVSIKQSQAFSLLFFLFISSKHQMPFFILFFIQLSFSQFNRPCLHLVPMSPRCRRAMGPQAQPWWVCWWGSWWEKSPRRLVWSRTTQDPAAISYSNLYFPGKHLLSSLAEKLASILPPNSCLVMPIRGYTVLSSRGEKRRRNAGRKGGVRVVPWEPEGKAGT